MALLRRTPLDQGVTILLPLAVLMFAFASSSVESLLRIGTKGRWIVLAVLAAIALARVAARRVRIRSLPTGWLVAGVLLLLGVESAIWSVTPRLTVERIVSVAIVFVTAAALALGSADPRAAAARVLEAILVGVALVAIGSLLLLAVSHADAVLAATEGAGWRFRGLGQSPNTVPMLLVVGLPIAVWLSLERTGRVRWLAVALVLLFAGELGFSGSRGGLVASFGGAIVTALVLGRSARVKISAAVALACLALAGVGISRIPSPLTSAAAASEAPAAQPQRHRGINAEDVIRLQDEIGMPAPGTDQAAPRREIFGSSGRIRAWRGALGQGLDRPVAGYGFGTENHVFVDRYYAFDAAFVENTYVGLFLQIGAVGLALFVGLLVALGVAGVRYVRRSPRGGAGPGAAALGVLVGGALIGFSQSGLLSVGNVAAASIWLCVLPLPLLAWDAAA